MKLYETLRTFNGVFALLPEHQKRLVHSCSRLSLEHPSLQKAVEGFMSQNDVCVKFIWNGTQFDMDSWQLPAWSGSFLYPEKWSYKIHQGSRTDAELKHLRPDWLEQARNAALEEGFDELLLVNEAGLICEGSISNVFLVKGPRIVTPSENCLPGIGRSLILKAAADRDVCVELRDVRVEELQEADAVFFVNSIRGVVLAEGSELMPITKKLIGWVSKFIQNRVDGNEDQDHGHHH